MHILLCNPFLVFSLFIFIDGDIPANDNKTKEEKTWVFPFN